MSVVPASVRLAWAVAALLAASAVVPATSGYIPDPPPEVAAWSIAEDREAVQGAMWTEYPTTPPSVACVTAAAALESCMPTSVEIRPRAGFPTGSDPLYLQISTGAADLPVVPYEGSGHAWGTSVGGANDVVTLSVELLVPDDHDCLAFDFRFLSWEYPVYVGSPYNDAFLAELDVSTWAVVGSAIVAPDNFAFDALGDPITINTASMSYAGATGTPYAPDHGGTDLLEARTPVTPGLHTVHFTIFDATDFSFTSTVYLDNLRTFDAPPGSPCYKGTTPPPPPPVPPPPPPPAPPKASFTVAQAPGCGPKPFTFTDTSTKDPGATIVSHVWELGDGTVATTPTVVHTYAYAGTYTVRLDILDSNGVASSTSRLLTVAPTPCPIPSRKASELPPLVQPPRDGIDLAVAGADLDSDDAPDALDNCPGVTNHFQEDLDRDGRGDACDPDADGDHVDDRGDTCPQVADPTQLDLDADGKGDACDPDLDGDGVADLDAAGKPLDNCRAVRNAGQEDRDGDRVGDACAGLALPSEPVGPDVRTAPPRSLAGAAEVRLAGLDAAIPVAVVAILGAALLGALSVVMRKRS